MARAKVGPLMAWAACMASRLKAAVFAADLSYRAAAAAAAAQRAGAHAMEIRAVRLFSQLTEAARFRRGRRSQGTTA